MQTNGAALFAVKYGSLACVQLVAQYGRWVYRLLYFAAVPTFRFSGGLASPRESTKGRLSRPFEVLAALGVLNRPHVSTVVVSTALASSWLRTSRLRPWLSGRVSQQSGCAVIAMATNGDLIVAVFAWPDCVTTGGGAGEQSRVHTL
jgi:hypothetical protein